MSRTKVIVRSWGDEPVVLFVHDVDKSTCYVGQEHSERAIGLPLTQVYPFDATSFEELRGAFSAGDANKLESVYSRLASVNTFGGLTAADLLRRKHMEEQGNLRVKFTVTGISPHSQGGTNVTLTAKNDGSIPENQRISEHPPNCLLSMVVDTAEATELLVLGKSYWIDISPATGQAAGAGTR